MVSTGEGAWPTERRGAVARMHRGALVWALSVLLFREIMASVPVDAAAAPEPGTCAGSGP